MKILVVDDDPDQRELRSLLLERYGFQPVNAADRTSAKQLAAEHQPAAAVVDLGLPSIDDGFALIRELKELDASIRVVVLTGSGKNAVQNYPALDLVDNLLTKPASTAELIRTLRSYE